MHEASQNATRGATDAVAGNEHNCNTQCNNVTQDIRDKRLEYRDLDIPLMVMAHAREKRKHFYRSVTVTMA